MEFSQEFVEKRESILKLLIDISDLSFLVFLISLVMIFAFRKSKKLKIFFIIIALGSAAFSYSYFLERNWLKVTEINLDKGWDKKVVLIADQHLGIFKDGEFMQRVVDKINQIEGVDFVVIAGDFTYWPQDFHQENKALQDIKVPMYAVLGNHDVVQSGHISFEKELGEILPEYGVTVLDNQIVVEQGISIYGLGSHLGHADDTDLLKNAKPAEEKVLILTHNPDTTSKKYPDVDLSDSITMTGHTHCGQVRIPFLYKHAIPTEGHFPNRGPYDLGKKGTLLITCGLGETGLPLRLFNRPEIMVVNL